MTSYFKPVHNAITIEILPEIADDSLLEFVQFLARKIAGDMHVPMGGVGGGYEPTRHNSAIVARIDAVPIGLIVWQEWQGGAFIGLAWTDQQYRGLGVYSRLVDELRKVAKERGLKSVDSAVHGNNDISIAAHQRIFGKPWMMCYRIEIE